MSLESNLKNRSDNKCELCESNETLNFYLLPPNEEKLEENSLLVCNTCLEQLERKTETKSDYWKFLSQKMWSDLEPVQIVCWRMLNRLKNESWASECLDMFFLEDEVLKKAKASGDHDSGNAILAHLDCNGNMLANGDNVVLIKSLEVKGSSVNARLGTVVRNIKLVHDNFEQIEGKIDGQTIVILTKYLRKG